MFFALALAAGLLVGLIGGGRPQALQGLRVRAWWLVPAGLILRRALALLTPGPHAVASATEVLGVIPYVALVACALSNLRLPGALAIGLGALANGVATEMAGGRMPVWVAATSRLPAAVVARLVAGQAGGHVAMARPHGILWLGDVLGLPRPLPPVVISLGDLAVALGAAALLALSMRAARPSPSRST